MSFTMTAVVTGSVIISHQILIDPFLHFNDHILKTGNIQADNSLGVGK